MNLEDIRVIFNRAVSLAFTKKKLLFVFITLLLCGIPVIFFRGLAMHAGSWVLMSLTFLPIFVSTAVLLSAGIVLVRVYHDEVKKIDVSYRQVMKNSWELIINVSYFSIPLILGYLLLWMTLGLFVLLSEIPTIGEFFGVVLSFGPFLINVGSLLLCLLSLMLLFFVTPLMGLKGMNRAYISRLIMHRLQTDAFSNVLLGLIALVPVLAIVALLILAAFLTETVITVPAKPLHIVLEWFVVMVPFTALLSPAVAFFFNFATESHVLIAKYLRENGGETT